MHMLCASNKSLSHGFYFSEHSSVFSIFVANKNMTWPPSCRHGIYDNLDISDYKADLFWLPYNLECVHNLRTKL